MAKPLACDGEKRTLSACMARTHATVPDTTPVMPTPSSQVRARQIAVIAVHGVGNHERGGPARAIADLLLNTSGAPYSGFEAHNVRVPLRPVALHDPERARVSVSDLE